MFLDPKVHFYTTLIFHIITFVTIFRVGMIILNVETGDVTMNNKLREELYDILWFLSAAIVPIFLYKKDECVNLSQQDQKQRIQSRG